MVATAIVGFRLYWTHQKEHRTGQLIVDRAKVHSYFRNHQSVRNIESIETKSLPVEELFRLPHLKSVKLKGSVSRSRRTFLSESHFGFLKRCPKLETLILRNCTLSCDEQALIWLSSLDAKLTGATSFSGVNFSFKGIEAVNKLDLEQVTFSTCSFTNKAIETLDFNRHNNWFTFERGNLTAVDVVKSFGEKAHRLRIDTTDCITLYSDTLEEDWRVTFRPHSATKLQVKADIFDLMPNLEAVALDSSRKSWLAAIKNCQPRVDFQCILRSSKHAEEIKGLVEATPSLQSVSVIGPF